MGNAGSNRNYPSPAATGTGSRVNLRRVCAAGATGDKRSQRIEIARSSTSIAVRITAALTIGKHKHHFLTETYPNKSAKRTRIGNK